MGQSKVSLTPDDWQEMIEFYKDSHTVQECATVWGVSTATVSRYFKKFGVKMRPRLTPASPEAARRLEACMFKKKVPQEELPEVPSSPPARRIIKLSDDEATLYEKEVE